MIEKPESSSSNDVVSRTLLAFAVASFLVALDRAIFSPLLPEMAADLNTSVGRAGLGVTAYVLPYGIFQLLFGPLGDRIGRVQVTRWCFVVFALGTGLSAVASSLIPLIALRAATGLCAAAVIPMGLSYIGDHVPYATRQSAITNLMSATAIGGALSTAVGGILGSIVSWRMVFVLYGVIAMVVAIAFFRLPVEPVDAATPAPGWRFRDVLSDGRARLIYALVAIEGVVVLGAFTYLGSYLRDAFDLDYFLIGLVLSGYGLGTLMTSRLLFPRILRGLTERRLVLFGGIALGAAYLALAPIPAWPLAFPAMLCMGLGFAMFHSTLQTRTTELAPHARGTAVSLFAFCAFVGGGIGSAGFGWLVEAAGYQPFLVVSGLLMLAIGFVAYLRW